MKYGVFYFKDTRNLGDDIQTYAAYRFLPRVDYFLEREELDSFVPHKKEYVAVIMSGWFLHEKYNFPPSPYIYPLPISLYFPEDSIVIKPGYEFLDGYVKEQLGKFGPIGGRDEGTTLALQKLGYDAYYSGCMTLTLPKVSKEKKKDYICVVDLSKEMIEYLKTITDREIIETTHTVDPNKYSKFSFEERMKKVEEQLALYQNAYMVVTNRLHVGLPCLALGTNTLLVYDDKSEDIVSRLGSYKDYFEHVSPEEFNTITKERLESVQNKPGYEKFQKILVKNVKAFLKKMESIDLDKEQLPDPKFYQEFVVKKNNATKELLMLTIRDQQKKLQRIWELEWKNKELEEQVRELQERWDNLEKNIGYRVVRKCCSSLKGIKKK